MKTNMNLSEEFKKALADHGEDFLVLRQGKLRCSCFNEVTLEASRICPLCLGLGYSFVAEKHRMRAEGAASSVQMINLMQEGQIGSIMTGHQKFFTLPTMKATEKDLIIPVEWDKFDRPTYSNRGIWKITNIDETQTLGAGQQIYKLYYASITPIRAKIRGIRLNEINGVKTYNILMEG